MQKGFSLIELLIGLAIAGVLMGIALPAYQSQIAQVNRRAAQSVLLEYVLQQAEFRLLHSQYADGDELDVRDSGTYRFVVSENSSSTFTLQAIAIGQQTNDSGCTTLSIDSSMKRAPLDCW